VSLSLSSQFCFEYFEGKKRAVLLVMLLFCVLLCDCDVIFKKNVIDILEEDLGGTENLNYYCIYILYILCSKCCHFALR
jgi:hypothetical protein